MFWMKDKMCMLKAEMLKDRIALLEESMDIFESKKRRFYYESIKEAVSSWEKKCPIGSEIMLCGKLLTIESHEFSPTSKGAKLLGVGAVYDSNGKLGRITVERELLEALLEKK